LKMSRNSHSDEELKANMDFENELRNFGRSQMPYRQTRENVELSLSIAGEDGSISLSGVARNLSSGGVAVLIEVKTMSFAKSQKVDVELKWPRDFSEGSDSDSDSLVGQVMWLESGEENQWIVGCRFLDLSETVAQRIARYLMSNIIKRNIQEE